MEYNYKDIVSKVKVYGITDSIVASGYPMKTEIPELERPNEKDLKRANNLSNAPAGSGEYTFLQGCVVQFNLTLPIKVWTEAQRYHFLDFVSSCSTMHCITKFDLTKDNAYDCHVDKRVIAIMQELVAEYNAMLQSDATPEEKAEKYLDVLMTNPNGFNLTARMTTNYSQLKTIYRQRRYHRLPQWRAFCKWIETLPCSFLITGEN